MDDEITGTNTALLTNFPNAFLNQAAITAAITKAQLFGAGLLRRCRIKYFLVKRSHKCP